jgi:hypothetical protein
VRLVAKIASKTPALDFPVVVPKAPDH